MADGAKLASAYYELIPSMKGAQADITNQILPATGHAGTVGGSSLGSSLLGGLKKFAGPIALLVAGFGVKKLISESTEAFEGLAAQTKAMQRIAGGTTEQVSMMSGALQLSGVAGDKAQGALTIFSKNLGNASADGTKTTEMVAKLGTGFLDAAGHVKPMAEIMPGLADKFKSMPDGAEKTALAMSLFGRQGATMIPFLNKGAAGIDELNKKAKTMGLVLDDTSMNIFVKGKVAARDYAAAIQGAKVSLGQDLAPVLESFANIGRGVMIPILNALVGVFGKLRAPAMEVAETVEKFAERVSAAVKAALGGTAGPLTAFGGMLSTFGEGLKSGLAQLGPILMPILSSIGSQFAALGPTFGSLLPQLLGLFSAFSPVQLIFKSLAPVLPQLISLLGGLAASVGGALGVALKAIIPAVTSVVGVLTGSLSQILIQLMPLISSLATQIGGQLAHTMVTLAPIIAQIASVLGQVLGTVLKQLMPIVAMLVGFVGQLLVAFMPLIGTVLSLIGPILQLIAPLLSLIGPILTPLIQLLSALLPPIASLVLAIVQFLVPVIQFLVTALVTLISWVVQGVTWFLGLVVGSKETQKGIAVAWGAILSFFSDVWKNIIGFFSTGVKGILDFFTGLPGKVMGALSSAGTWLVDVGKNMIQGLLDGASSLLKNIGSFFLKILPSWIVDPFKAALGIHSPSTVFAGHGRNIVQGLINGIGSMEGQVSDSLSSLVASPSLSVTSSMIGAGVNVPAASNTGRDSDMVTLVDVDGSIIARLKKVAGQVVAAASDERKTDLSTGKQVLAF